VLPEQAPSLWGQPQWEAVLLHEAAHIARRDPWAAFAQCLAVILFWWCPLVHLMARRLNDLREAICDDYALEGPCDRLAYAELLVESAERLVNLRTMPVPVGLIDSARRGLEERITRLLAKEKEPMKKLSLAGKLLGASFLVAACLSISAATAFTQTPPAKKIQIKIILDGKEIDLDAASLAALLQAVQPKAEAAAKPADTFEKPTRIEVQLQAGQPGAAPQAIELAWKLVDANLNVTQVKPGAAPLQPDPRIEELVKQAEAIKPGSGADIRRALQAKAKPGNSYFHYNPTPDGKLYYAVPSTPATGHGQIEPGKHVIVLTVDASGKVAQLQGAELKKFLAAAEGDKKFAGDLRDYMEKAVSEAQRAEALKAEAMKAAKVLRSAKAGAPPSTATPPGMIAPVPPKMPVPAPPVPSGLPPARVVPAPPPAADVEALARQIDRITAELQELRKRLDANKK
jgi:hypothetical protein